jgi:hypothetical protein
MGARPHEAVARYFFMATDIQSPEMLVADLHHFLDLPPDTPGPARRLAEHLSNIVRAATAGDAATSWESSLPCQRRTETSEYDARVDVY